MEAFLGFLVDNYLVFLLIALILIFALIGYLVDTRKKEQKEDIKQFEEDLELVSDEDDVEETNLKETPDILEIAPKEEEEDIKQLEEIEDENNLSDLSEEELKEVELTPVDEEKNDEINS